MPCLEVEESRELAAPMSNSMLSKPDVPSIAASTVLKVRVASRLHLLGVVYAECKTDCLKSEEIELPVAWVGSPMARTPTKGLGPTCGHVSETSLV
jgi:hypothetical protein